MGRTKRSDRADPADEQVVRRRLLHGRTLGRGQIVEENLFYDLVTFMKQIGLGK